MSVSRFLACAAVSAVVWAGSWIGLGYLVTHGIAGLGWSFGISLTFVIIAVALAGWQLRRQAERRLLLHTLGEARAGSQLSAAERLWTVSEKIGAGRKRVQ